MCNLYSITTNQAAIAALFRVVNRYVGNLAPMPGVFPDYPAPVIRNTDTGTEMTLMRWGMPDARIYIEKLNAPFLYVDRGTPEEYLAGLKFAIERGWIKMHESGTF